MNTIDYDQERRAEAYVRHRRVHPRVLNRLLAYAKRGARTLDVGCGTGNYVAALREIADCDACGIDPSEEMLSKARRQVPTADLRHGCGENLRSFGDASFDLVFSVDVIHHIKDLDAHYAECFRVLTPGGICCTVTDSEDAIRRRVPLSRYFPETVDIELERYPSMSKLSSLLNRTGFVDIHEETVEHSYEMTDVTPYREKAFSSLHLIPEDALRYGIDHMLSDLAKGPIEAISLYTMLWGAKPRKKRSAGTITPESIGSDDIL